jgi:hypothetical protein
MLGRLKMSIQECVDAYSTISSSVFNDGLVKSRIRWIRRQKARFDSAKLQDAIKNIIEERGLDREALLMDPNNPDPKCKM